MFLGIRNFVQALDQCPHQSYTLIIQGHVKGSESLGQAASPHPVSMLGARGALTSSSFPPQAFCCCRQTGLSLVRVSVMKTARSWEAWSWQASSWSWESCPALAALGAPGACMHVVFLLSGLLRAQGLIGSRWQAWQMLLS